MYGYSQVLLEPHGDRRDQRYLENSQGRTHEDAEVQEELPGDGNQADDQRGGDKMCKYRNALEPLPVWKGGEVRNIVDMDLRGAYAKATQERRWFNVKSLYQRGG